MKRRNFFWALTIAVAFNALLFGGCATVQSRISAHPEIYQSLSPQDQALVSQGRIREGMTQNAVWLAWGSPEQKMVGAARGRPVETWLYLGFGTVAVFHTHSHRRFVVFGDPFFDPFFFPSYIPPREAYPSKTVSFVNGRVVSFQFLVGPYRY